MGHRIRLIEYCSQNTRYTSLQVWLFWSCFFIFAHGTSSPSCFQSEPCLLNTSTMLSTNRILSWKCSILSYLKTEDIGQDILSQDMSKNCSRHWHLNVLAIKLTWGDFMYVISCEGTIKNA